MLDEFDKLQEGIENGVTSPQVPENIRYLVQSYSRFSAILTGSRRMKRLRDEYWSALYGLGTREGVTALEESAARRLIIDPVKRRLTYTREAVDHLIRVSARQPFVMQCLCNRVFDLAAELKARTVGLDLVERACEEIIQGWEHFASLWDYAGTHRRRFLLALVHRDSKENDPVTLALLREHLSREGIDVSEASLIEDIEFLRELELLDFDGRSDTYGLTIPLMGDWIDAQQDHDSLRTKARAENLDAPEEFVWTEQDETAAKLQMFNVDSEAELEEFLDSWGD
jgi:type I restriction enzyme M protein